MCNLHRICITLNRLNQTYHNITIEAGKLLDSWKDDLESMFACVAYVIFVNNIDPSFFLNMDETSLKIVPSSGKAHAMKGSSNVFVYGVWHKE